MDNEKDVNKLWKFIHDAEEDKNIICCYTSMGKVREEKNKELGVIKGHAYTILDS